MDLALCSNVIFFIFFFSVLLSSVITSLVEEKLVFMFLAHMFDYFARVNVSFFSASWCQWLRLVIVALPALFY